MTTGAKRARPVSVQGAAACAAPTLGLALSPYHLSTREPPAMLALALGTRAITLLPKPAAGSSREDVRLAVNAAPRYLRLLESWRWSAPLWDAGVADSVLADDDSAVELSSVYDAIRTRSDLAPLRPLTKAADERAGQPARALDAIADDLLRGGPDPGICIPITAALDRFAFRHGLAVVRSATASITQRAESRLGRRLCSFSLPMLRRAGGGRILRLRDDLRSELDAIRGVLMVLGRDCPPGVAEPPRSSAPADGTIAACAAFARAFDAWARDNARGDDENDQRITVGYLGVTALAIPADAALRSSRAAVRSLSRVERCDEPEAPPGHLFALVVRVMNVRPAAV